MAEGDGSRSPLPGPGGATGSVPGFASGKAQMVRLDEVLLEGAVLVAAPMRIEGADLFRKEGRFASWAHDRFYLADRDQWLEVAAELRRRKSGLPQSDAPLLPKLIDMREAVCAVCREPMITNQPGNTSPTCSAKCRAKLDGLRADKRREQDKLKMRRRRGFGEVIEKVCPMCGEPFSPKRKDAVTCSVQCRQRKSYRRGK